MINRLFQFITLVFFLPGNVFSQSDISNPAVNLFEHAASSPNSAGLGKYFDYPVNMSTGIPGIDIPIFTIKTGNIVLPITLRYHAGGVRINESASWVGMNWSLDAGGVINKRINGMDDFFQLQLDNGPASDYLDPHYTPFSSYFTSITDAIESPGLASYASTNAVDLQHFLGRIPQGWVDGEADEYFFSTPANSGKFFYNQKLRQFQTDKPDGWIVTGTPPPAPAPGDVGGAGSWYLQSNNAISYGFGQIEQYQNPLINHPIRDPAAALYMGFPTPYLTSAWYLTQINDYNTNKNLSIGYEVQRQTTCAGFDMSNDYAFLSHRFHGENFQEDERVGDEVSIAGIQFDEGSVSFIKDDVARIDGGTNALKEIQVKNNFGQVIKRFVFTYFYTNADAATNNYIGKGSFLPYPTQLAVRMFLQSVQEITINAHGDTIKNAPYTFTYNLDHPLPCRLSFAQDYWGFYNGKTSNTTLIPNQPLVDNDMIEAAPAANRDIDTVYTKAGIIKELYYPTGGKAVFEFENNISQFGLTGGLRVRQITNYDNVSNSSLVTRYDYKDENGNESGVQQFKQVNSYTYGLISDGNNEAAGQAILRVEGQPIYPLFTSGQSSVLYTCVSKKDISDSNEIVSRHHFLDLGVMDNYQNNPGELGGVPHNKYSFYDGFSGLEYETETFKTNADGSSTLIQKDSTDFQPLDGFKNYFWNVQGAWSMDLTNTWIVFPQNDPYGGGDSQPLTNGVDINAYKIMRELPVPKQKSQVVYDGSQVLRTQTFMDYDITNGNNKLVRTVNSKGDTLIRFTKFVTDYGNYGAPAGWNAELSGLYGANVTNAPVEILNYIKKKSHTDSLLLDGTLFEYDGLHVRRIYKRYAAAPVAAFHVSYNNSTGFYYDSSYTLFQEVKSRDNNFNPLTVYQDSKKESYIWDYSNSFMVALIKNAKQSDVAYTSFESDGAGNWTIASANRDITASITGEASYKLDSGSITKDGLDGNTVYVVSYWSKNGPFTVSNTQSVKQGGTSNGWTCYEHTITNASSVAVSGAGNIDELRLYPAQSQMTTYTYEPLVGMTSQCSVNNTITYYEYDDFSRLSRIRDKDGNILKSFCYNYEGQVENCTRTYFNKWMSKTFTRSHCDVEHNPGPVAYVVPGAKYNSTVSQQDANAQAVADINANGQAYADNNGPCTPKVIYAKITYENEDPNQHTADIVVHFYGNMAGTEPYSFGNVTVQLQEEDYNDISGSGTYQALSFTASGSDFTLIPGAILFKELNDSFHSNLYITFSVLSTSDYTAW